jgi:ribosome-associated translation inhibitor RaiA
MPLQLTFRRMAHSEALAAQIGRRAEKLERLFDRVISCHVVVELVGHHHRHGDRYRVSINLGLPGRELLVRHALPDDERTSETASRTADRAFDEAERQLEDWASRRRQHRHQETRST